MGIKQIFIILVDISGYTKFIRMHKVSLLHAEKIISELLEVILDKVESPVVIHEMLGDALSLYAVDDGTPDLADHIYNQLEEYFEAFRKREAFLLRECGYCFCDACTSVEKLKLKAILHHGKAAFTKVRDIEKISGEDIIIAHRLLKNSIPSDEYILATQPFVDKFRSIDDGCFEEHVEEYEVIGKISCKVKDFEPVEETTEKVSPWQKLKFFLTTERYLLSRIFGKPERAFRNLSP